MSVGQDRIGALLDRRLARREARGPLAALDDMRGVTLWRPWPGAFLLERRPGRPGPKECENRDSWWPRQWTRPMEGGVAEADPARPLQLAIHAGQRSDRGALSAIRSWGFPEMQAGEAGVIVCVARLVRVLDVAVLTLRHPLLRALAPWASGRFVWQVGDVRRLREPVSCGTADGVGTFQGLWRMPDAVRARVEAQL